MEGRSNDWDKMSSHDRGPFIVASYHLLVHLAKWFQRRRFLEIDQSETRIACGAEFFEGGATQAQPTEPLVRLFPRPGFLTS
jgi:hypothetical protein